MIGRRRFVEGIAVASASLLIPRIGLAVPSASQETLDALDDATSSYESARARLADLAGVAEMAQWRYDETRAEMERMEADVYDASARYSDADAELARSKAALADRLAKDHDAGENGEIVALLATSDPMSIDASSLPSPYDVLLSSVQDATNEASAAGTAIDEAASARERIAAQQGACKSALEASMEDLQRQVDDYGPLVSELQEKAAAEAADSREAHYLSYLTNQESYEKAAADAEALMAMQDGWRGSGVHDATVLDWAFQYIGYRYVYGASDPDVGFDCSGLTSWCYARAGHWIPRTSYEQMDYVKSLGNWTDDWTALAPGDLIFPIYGHVALYCGGGMMIHSPAPGDVVTYAEIYGPVGGGSPLS